MKRFLTILLAILALSACQSTESRVQDVAETFLNAYYSGDYEAAAASCTPEYGERLTRYSSALDGISPQMKAKMQENLSQTSFQIDSIKVDESAASAFVHYHITTPSLDKPVPKGLKLQLEGRTALVDGIQ